MMQEQGHEAKVEKKDEKVLKKRGIRMAFREKRGRGSRKKRDKQNQGRQLFSKPMTHGDASVGAEMQTSVIANDALPCMNGVSNDIDGIPPMFESSSSSSYRGDSSATRVSEVHSSWFHCILEHLKRCKEYDSSIKALNEQEWQRVAKAMLHQSYQEALLWHDEQQGTEGS